MIKPKCGYDNKNKQPNDMFKVRKTYLCGKDKNNKCEYLRELVGLPKCTYIKDVEKIKYIEEKDSGM